MGALRIAAGYLSAVAGCGLASAAGYLWVLAAASRLRRRPPPPAVEPRHRFLIVIPAHNEEAGLAACLSRLGDLDYPDDHRRVLVVADNCTDATAEVARACGAEVITRVEPQRVGKGYALAYALGLLDDSVDAVVVLDADARPERGLLRALDARLSAGQEAIQVRYVSTAVRGRPLSYPLSVESLLENDWFYRGKEQLGSPTLLRGNGMCLSRGVLRRVPWEAYGLAEDVEYTVRAVRAGIRPRYAAEAGVASAAPASPQQVAQQRRRWTAGHWQVAVRHSPRFIAAGLARRDWRLIDFGLGLLVTSKSALLAAGVLAAALARWLSPPGPMRTIGLSAAGAAIVGLSGYGLLGIAASRPTSRQAASLAWLLPLAAIRAAAGVGALLGVGRGRWVRTARDETAADID